MVLGCVFVFLGANFWVLFLTYDLHHSSSLHCFFSGRNLKIYDNLIEIIFLEYPFRITWNGLIAASVSMFPRPFPLRSYPSVLVMLYAITILSVIIMVIIIAISLCCLGVLHWSFYIMFARFLRNRKRTFGWSLVILGLISISNAYIYIYILSFISISPE